jgi:hypothetical protein
MTKRIRRAVILVMGLPVLALIVAAGGGLFLSETHVVTSRARYAVSADSLWAEVSDPERAAVWRPDIQQVERLPDRDGRTAWKEVGATGALTYERTVYEPPARMVVRIAEPDLPFSGEWTYEVAPADGGAVLTLTERGAIPNPVYRFLARFLFGYHSALDGYLTALGARFGEDTVPRHGSGETG